MRKLDVEFVECAHHIRGFVTFNGRRILTVHYSFGNKDLPAHVPHLFRRSLRLTSEEFAQFRACHMSRADYLALLQVKGVTD